MELHKNLFFFFLQKSKAFLVYLMISSFLQISVTGICNCYVLYSLKFIITHTEEQRLKEFHDILGIDELDKIFNYFSENAEKFVPVVPEVGLTIDEREKKQLSDQYHYAADEFYHYIVEHIEVFERAIELSRVFSGVKDHAGFFELLTTLVSQVKALTPGSSIVIPGGFRGGLLLYVLHADSFEECTLAVCASGDGLEYHPCARGIVRTNAPPNPV